MEIMDVDMLDYVVDFFYDPLRLKEGRKAAHEILLVLQKDPSSLFQVRKILENSKCLNTKLFALKVLEGVIKNRWNELSMAEKDGISFYIWDVIQQLLTNEASFQEWGRLYVNKLNIILVEILKHDSSARWQNFIPSYLSFVSNAEASDIMRENFMNILKLLIEDVFEFSKAKVTKEIVELEKSLNSKSILIYEFCSWVLSTSKATELISATLSTLHTVLSCIPSDNFFKLSLLDSLLENFQWEPYSNLVLKCLIEVVALDFPNINTLQVMYCKFINALQSLFPLNIEIPVMYAHGSSKTKAFVQNLATFFTSFYEHHIDVLETNGEVRHALLIGLQYLVKISHVNDMDVQKDCLNYWNSFVLELLKPHFNLDSPAGTSDIMGLEMPLPLDVVDGLVLELTPRKQLYAELMSNLRMLLISCMSKLDELLILKDENGNFVREIMMDNDALVQDKIRETLIYLSHLYPEDTEKQMLSLLGEQLSGQDLDLNNFNRLCWAIGSISGSVMKELENKFLVSVIDRLLKFISCTNCEQYKAVVGINYMYVVGQYPRLLRDQWELLKAVVNKFFEFMRKTQPRIRDMACYTFLKIVQDCKHQFVVVQVGENKPFASELLSLLPDFFERFEPHQIYTFFESFGHMIQIESDIQKRDEYLQRLMKLPNQKWNEIIGHSSERFGFLKDQDLIRIMLNILQINTSVARSLGTGFKYQISLMFDDMLHVCRRSSELVSSSIVGGCSYASKTSHVEALRSVRSETLKLIETFFDKAEEQPEIVEEFLLPMIYFILEEFSENWLDTIESELFSLSASIVKMYKGAVANFVDTILDAFCSCTLEITKTFDHNPEHCLKFFFLLHAIATHFFSALTDSSVQKLFMDSTIWAIWHTERNIAESGLNLLLEMLKKFQNSEICNQFHKDYYLTILENIFGVLTDTFHKPGFKLHVMVLQHLFCLVGKDGSVTEPLWDVNDSMFRRNERFVHEFMRKLITPFSKKTYREVVEDVKALFGLRHNIRTFRFYIRSILLESEKFSFQDDTDLFPEFEEFEAAEREETRKIMLSIIRHR